MRFKRRNPQTTAGQQTAQSRRQQAFARVGACSLNHQCRWQGRWQGRGQGAPLPAGRLLRFFEPHADTSLSLLRLWPHAVLNSIGVIWAIYGLHRATATAKHHLPDLPLIGLFALHCLRAFRIKEMVVISIPRCRKARSVYAAAWPRIPAETQ